MQTIWNLQMITIICKKNQIQLFANCKLFVFCKQFIVNRWWWLCCVECKSTTAQHNQQQQQTTNCLYLQTIWNLQMIAKNTNAIICKLWIVCILQTVCCLLLMVIVLCCAQIHNNTTQSSPTIKTIDCKMQTICDLQMIAKNYNRL